MACKIDFSNRHNVDTNIYIIIILTTSCTYIYCMHNKLAQLQCFVLCYFYHKGSMDTPAYYIPCSLPHIVGLLGRVAGDRMEEERKGSGRNRKWKGRLWLSCHADHGAPLEVLGHCVCVAMDAPKVKHALYCTCMCDTALHIACSLHYQKKLNCLWITIKFGCVHTINQPICYSVLEIMPFKQWFLLNIFTCMNKK